MQSPHGERFWRLLTPAHSAENPTEAGPGWGSWFGEPLAFTGRCSRADRGRRWRRGLDDDRCRRLRTRRCARSFHRALSAHSGRRCRASGHNNPCCWCSAGRLRGSTGACRCGERRSRRSTVCRWSTRSEVGLCTSWRRRGRRRVPVLHRHRRNVRWRTTRPRSRVAVCRAKPCRRSGTMRSSTWRSPSR